VTGFFSVWGAASAHVVLPGASQRTPFLRMILRMGKFLRT